MSSNQNNTTLNTGNLPRCEFYRMGDGTFVAIYATGKPETYLPDKPPMENPERLSGTWRIQDNWWVFNPIIQ